MTIKCRRRRSPVVLRAACSKTSRNNRGDRKVRCECKTIRTRSSSLSILRFRPCARCLISTRTPTASRVDEKVEENQQICPAIGRTIRLGISGVSPPPVQEQRQPRGPMWRRGNRPKRNVAVAAHNNIFYFYYFTIAALYTPLCRQRRRLLNIFIK